MAEFDYDIGVIGGGAAGLTVASGAAQLGVKTVLIERASQLGGDCLHTGCVPSKTLIRSAAIYHEMRQCTRYGLPEVILPPVDMAKVNLRIKEVIDAIQVHDSEERFCGLGVKILFGEAQFEDDHVVNCSGTRISAKFWVLATGSEPALPSIPGLVDVDYLTNEDMFSLKDLPSSLVVLGGGPIGCEMAQAFNRLGSKVHILQRNCQLLSAEDADMAQVIQDVFQEEGVDLALCANTSMVRRVPGGVEVEYERDGETHVIQAEKILVATGRRPRTNGLKLENCGVEYDRRGVKVDARLRTSQKHIFAAGDVLGRYQFTHAAGYEGGIVISNAVFRLPRKVDYTWLPWCTYTEPELASVGMNEKRAKAAGIECVVWEEAFGDNDRARAEGGVNGRIKLVLDRREKPLGVQIAGIHAGELIGQWVAALNGKVGLSTLASAIQPYPTVGEINKRVAGKVLSSKLFSDRVRKTLSFIFDYKGRACTLD
ncbi:MULTISPECIES: FAD-dependent oxidoreductase [unclassified Pseudodesulfovibrio]|uniref:dihydrolipoyl dehydrogenase family protein n=1 Tax=unclassified Pseudodesulfovibrio TaxID=2661612 RepID=UPI000FEC0233|nr:MULTISPECIES: FAD-dependent oxidoreductase [unclassified Pseudodesulfovibrio]MCJ2163960.1 FAD-dependent oxidoreductase [Pseudodesulfovibrio sp. S3-i]RWU05795.1 FAD-dependent oxidoreductase [Pseudodesulfovibrio sp. S3]